MIERVGTFLLNTISYAWLTTKAAIALICDLTMSLVMLLSATIYIVNLLQNYKTFKHNAI